MAEVWPYMILFRLRSSAKEDALPGNETKEKIIIGGEQKEDVIVT